MFVFSGLKERGEKDEKKLEKIWNDDTDGIVSLPANQRNGRGSGSVSEDKVCVYGWKSNTVVL